MSHKNTLQFLHIILLINDNLGSYLLGNLHRDWNWRPAAFEQEQSWINLKNTKRALDRTVFSDSFLDFITFVGIISYVWRSESFLQRKVYRLNFSVVQCLLRKLLVFEFLEHVVLLSYSEPMDLKCNPLKMWIKNGIFTAFLVFGNKQHIQNVFFSVGSRECT